MKHRPHEQAAIALVEQFTGHHAETIDVIDIPADDTLVTVGECEAIAYTATRDGETNSYQHEFAKGSRPLLAVSHDGKRLYLLGGTYQFTSHGIEDR